jgi:hypothetical protein
LSLQKLELSYLEHIEADIQPGMGRFPSPLCALYVTLTLIFAHIYLGF